VAHMERDIAGRFNGIRYGGCDVIIFSSSRSSFKVFLRTVT